MKKTVEYFLLTTILIGALFVRLYKVENPIADWHSWRQVDTASVTKIYKEEGINLLYPKYYDISNVQTGYFNPEGLRFVEFPIYNVLHLGLLNLFPSLSIALAGRLLSIFSALTSVFVLYLLGKKMFNESIGLLWAFFYSFIPFNIYFTRVILPEPMAVTFGLLSLYFYILYDDNEKKLPLFFSAIFMAMALLLKPFMAFYGLFIAYLAVSKYGIKNIFKNIPLLIALDVALIPFFLWRIWMNQRGHLIGIPHFGWAFNGDNIRFKPSYWYWLYGERIGNMILGVWGIIPLSAILLAKKNKYHKAVLNLVLGAILYMVIIATASVRHDYYQTLIMPSIVMLLGLGSYELWNLKTSKYIAKGVLIFSIFIMLLLGWYRVRDNYAINNSEHLIAANKIDKTLPKDAVIIAPQNGSTVFLYHTGRYGWPIVTSDIQSLIDQGADYYVSVNFADPDTVSFQNQFEVVEKNDQFIVINLNKPTNN